MDAPRTLIVVEPQKRDTAIRLVEACPEVGHVVGLEPGDGLRRPSAPWSAVDAEATERPPALDLIELDRIRRVLDRHGERFLGRIYTREEINRYRDRLPELAVRFAAKEAFSKALGVGLREGGIRWREVEVLPDRRGKPEIQVSGRAAQLCEETGIRGMHLSLTDEDNHAVAVVVLET